MSITKKAPAAGDGGALNVSTWPARDIRDNKQAQVELQTKYVARRARLTPALADVVASLVFGRTPA